MIAGRNNTITHIGKVVAIATDTIGIVVARASACSDCHAKGFCTSTDSKDTVISVPNRGINVSLNEEVKVSINRSVGFRAVAIAFILPIVLMLVIIFTLSAATNLSEELCGIIGLTSLIPYFVLLRLLSYKLTKKFTFHIEKLQ